MHSRPDQTLPLLQDARETLGMWVNVFGDAARDFFGRPIFIMIMLIFMILVCVFLRLHLDNLLYM